MRVWKNAPPVKVATTWSVQRGFDFTDVGIARDRADVDHDPLNPDWEEPTPLDMVLRLTQPERFARVQRLTEMAWERYEEALGVHGQHRTLEAVAGLISGGKDSLTIAHLFRPAFTHIVHANTGTGIQATRTFVGSLADMWGLPFIMHSPQAGYGYWDMVYGTMRTKDGTRQPYPGGFPGSAMHAFMYQRLKERSLDGPTKKDLGVYGSRTKRAIYLAGRRRTESQRRDTVPHHEERGPIGWASPIAIWHKADLVAYRLLHRTCPTDGCLHSPGLGRTSFGPVPINPVAEKLGRSGDCGCLANVSANEPQQWHTCFPQEPFLQQVRQAESDLKNRLDIPWWRRTWGWGAVHDDRSERRKEAGRLCGADCGRDPLLDLMDPLFPLDQGIPTGPGIPLGAQEAA